MPGSETRVPKELQTHNVMKDDFGWEVPIEVVPIPSEGKVYPQDSPLYGKNCLEIKAMTAQEEDILASRALIMQGTVITNLLQSCLLDKTVSTREMLLGDRNALMVSIRITGYGTTYRAEASCPECSATNMYAFDLSGLEIKRLEIAPVREGENLFSFTLPVTRKGVHFRFLTGADEEERNQLAERRKKLMPDLKIDNMVTSRLEQTIVSVDGITDRTKINMFVKNMPARDSRALRSFIEKNEPGIDMSTWMACSQCGEGSKVGLPLGTGFFWPRE